MEILKVENLYKSYISNKLLDESKKQILKNISFSLKKGKILGIVGESGSGKSTLAKCIMGLEDIDSGKIFYKNQDTSEYGKNDVKRFKSEVQIVFQNPYSTLHPRMKVGDIVAEPLIYHSSFNKNERKKKVEDLFLKLGLSKSAYDKYPNEFSGGQRQRIGIARALVLDPEIIIADEPVSALDVSVQAEILNLFLDLQKEYNITIIFISHDLSVVRHLADSVIVLYKGQIVEAGSMNDVFMRPIHSYTKKLLSAIPGRAGYINAKIYNEMS